jgi:CheY-like chemotaxis protein
VLFLTDIKRQDQALKLALRAHGADLCYVRDVSEFAAFLPAASAAGIAIDLVVIDHAFDPAAFNIAAANALNFRMLPAAADESLVMAEILTALPGLRRLSVAAPSMEPPQLIEGPVTTADAPDILQPARLDVLAVEDNPVNRLVLEQILGSISVNFRIAGSAAEGLADYATCMPRLVLSDTTLPDMPATDFALSLRRIDPSAVLVALVAADTAENHRQAKAAGFDHSLSKPLSAEALDALVPDLLEARQGTDAKGSAG